MTDLFPPENQPITMKQGQAGDCFVLAILDALFNAPGGLSFVKSLFSVDKNGVVTLTIKRNVHSLNFVGEKLERAKQRYQFRQTATEDIFVFTPERLKELDGATDFLTTNSMAVKILEHIVPYYYVGDMIGIADNKPAPHVSVLAYNKSSQYKYKGDSAPGLLRIYWESPQRIPKIFTL